MHLGGHPHVHWVNVNKWVNENKWANGSQAATRGNGSGVANGGEAIVDSRQASPVVDQGATLQFQDQGSLQIRTAEGDTVSISFDAQAKWAAGSHLGAQGSTASLSSSHRVQVQVQVDGNLSDAELADIRKLVAGLTGQNQDSPQIGDLSTLAAYQYGETQSVQTGTYFRLAA